MRIPPRDGPRVVSWMAIIALRPAARSAQKTTCSWSSTYMLSKRNIATPSHCNENVVAINQHFELLLYNVRVVPIHASRDIVFPPMPGTGDNCSTEFSLTQRPALMGADIIDGVVGAVHIEDGDPLSLNLDTLALTGGNLAGLGDFDEIGHAVLLLGP